MINMPLHQFVAVWLIWECISQYYSVIAALSTLKLMVTKYTSDVDQRGWHIKSYARSPALAFWFIVKRKQKVGGETIFLDRLRF